MTSVHAVSPVFLVADVAATAHWYEEVLGFTFDHFPDREPFEWAGMQHGGAQIMLARSPGYARPDRDSLRPGGVWDAYLYVSGLDEFYARVSGKAEVRRPPCPQPYGLREFEIADPNGYVLVFGERIGA